MKAMMSIKFFFAVIIVWFCTFSLSAQSEDSVAFHTDRDTSVKYVTPLEYAFMMHEETKFMLRSPVFGVGAELEILPYFTWMTQVYYPLFQLNSVARLPDINSELRYYVSSRKLGVRNMSGNYLAAGAKYEDDPYFFTEIPDYGYYIKWGMQRRILGNGLADIGIIAGFSSDQNKGVSRFGFFIKSPVSLGFGFVFGERSLLDRDRLCPVLKCHEIERFLLKINFSNLINYYFLELPNEQHQMLSVNPNVSLEKKMFNSPFSINVDLLWFISEFKIDHADYPRNIANNNFEGMAGLRWYYNMGRRMRLGKGGNGLSGNYLSGGVGGYYRTNEYIPNSDLVWHDRLFPFVSTGIQRTLGRRLYFDLNIGIRESQKIFRFTGLEIGRSADAEFFGNANIGLKF